MGDLRSAGSKVSRDGRHVGLGTRSFGNPRYGLAMLDKHGVREIAGQGSLTRCGFDDDLTLALCVQESMTRPPALVRSEEHTSELQSLMRISYAVFCLKKKIQHFR